MMKSSEVHFEDGPVCNGLHLYWACHALALQARKRFRGCQLLPSGARIFYYTRRLLLAEGLPEVLPDKSLLPASMVERFLQAAPLVTERLATEFARAVRLRAEPDLQLKILLGTPFMGIPATTWLPEHLLRSHGGIPQSWEQVWETSWHEAEQEHLARLRAWLRPDRLLVVPVAGTQLSLQLALRLLQAQVADDAGQGYSRPSGGAYLYDEPLEEWLLRPLLTGCWFSRLCLALVESTDQVRMGESQ